MRITALRTVAYTYAAGRPLSDVNFPEGRQEQRTTALFIDTDEGITGVAVRELERHYPIYWAEEPADRWDYRGLAKVSAGVTAQVATGENLKDPTEIGPLIEHGAMDVFEPNPKGMGVTGALIASDTCSTFRIPVAMMNSPGNYAAHVAAALPNHMMMEVPDLGRDVWFTVDAELRDGEIILGDTPGFGFTLDLEKLEELSRRPSPHAHAGLMPRRPGAGVIPSPVRS